MIASLPLSLALLLSESPQLDAPSEARMELVVYCVRSRDDIHLIVRYRNASSSEVLIPLWQVPERVNRGGLQVSISDWETGSDFSLMPFMDGAPFGNLEVRAGQEIERQAWLDLSLFEGLEAALLQDRDLLIRWRYRWRFADELASPEGSQAPNSAFQRNAPAGAGASAELRC